MQVNSDQYYNKHKLSKPGLCVMPGRLHRQGSHCGQVHVQGHRVRGGGGQARHCCCPYLGDDGLEYYKNSYSVLPLC